MTMRLVGMLFGGLLLLLALPTILAAGALIRMRSPGPMFVQLQREGRNGRPFAMLKLRTMHADAEQRLAGCLIHPERQQEWQQFGRLRHDPRIVGRFGRLARKTSVDELPQLWNVIRGEMAIVGPRPLPSAVAALLPKKAVTFRRRVTPGMTGLWQISGRADTSLARMGALDLLYVRNRSIWLDLMILLRTPFAVFSQRGAY